MQKRTYYSEIASAIPASSTMSVASLAEKMIRTGTDVVKFSVGEPDFDTPEHICRSARRAMEEGFTHYTAAPGILPLREAISEKFRRDNGLEYPPEQIVVSNGAKQSLFNAFMAVLNPGDEVLIPVPAWISYVHMVRLAGAIPVTIPARAEERYIPVREVLEASVTSRTKALVINSPNNPSGMVYTLEDLEMLAEFAEKHDLFVIADEIYEKLIYRNDRQHVSIASLGKEIFDRTITVNGLSKSYAMTGWRVGFSGACPELARIMSNLQSHTTAAINSIAQKAALEALRGDQTCVESMRREFAKRRDVIYERVRKIPGWSVREPEGAFYLFVDVSGMLGMYYAGEKIESSSALAEMLLRHAHVALVSCEDFGVDNHIRISYAASMERILEGVSRIERFCQQLEGGR